MNSEQKVSPAVMKERERYAQLEEKHKTLAMRFDNLNAEHTALLRKVNEPRPTVRVGSNVKHMCRVRAIIAESADNGPTYSQWGPWERIAKEDYVRDAGSAEYAGVRQYRVQSG